LSASLGAHNGHWAACIAKRADKAAATAKACGAKVGGGSKAEGAKSVNSKPGNRVGGGGGGGDLPASCVVALDISPPEPYPRQHPVVGPGTAESLASLPHQTLLVCMPSPGELIIYPHGGKLVFCKTFFHVGLTRLVNPIGFQRRNEILSG